MDSGHLYKQPLSCRNRNHQPDDDRHSHRGCFYNATIGEIFCIFLKQAIIGSLDNRQDQDHPAELSA